MNIAAEIKNTTDVVKEILKQSPKARSSDSYLIYAVLATVGKRNGIDIEKMSLPHFLLHMKEYGFPSFETIRRTRQKIQAAHPELAGSDEVQAQREINETVFREYAKGCVK